MKMANEHMKRKTPSWQEQRGSSCGHNMGLIQDKCVDCGMPLKPFDVQRREMHNLIIEIKKDGKTNKKSIEEEFLKLKKEFYQYKLKMDSDFESFTVTTNRQISELGSKLHNHSNTIGGHDFKI